MDNVNGAGVLSPPRSGENQSTHQICPECGREAAPDAMFCSEDGALLSRSDSMIGRTLAGKYRVEKELGSGGMCVVYKARHAMMGKIVAIKVLHPHLAIDRQIVERFQLEALAASRVHNPHAINVTDFGVTPEGCPFLVMDFIQGETLGEVIAKFGALTVERTADILQQAAIALGAAHDRGVIHRDIKPDNMIISEYDMRDWVTVLDFGVAKIQEDLNQRTSLTGENCMIGTPRYMSPEQAENKPVDVRSDIYSLGVVVYEMLAGEAPFQSDSSTRLLLKHASETPPSLREKRPDISPEVEAVVMRALSKDPSERPQSPMEFSKEFNAAADIEAPAAIDRGGAFTRITVPIVSDTSSEIASEDTVVRPREVSDPTPAYLPLPGRPVSTIEVRSEPSPWPSVIIALVAVLVIGAAGYFFLIRGFNPNNGNDITVAQQAVVDARARIESLPPENSPLRSALPQLLQWQGELSGFAAAPQKTPEMVNEAHMITDRANALSEQARKQLAAIANNTDNNATKNAEPENVQPQPTGDPDSEASKPVDNPVVTPGSTGTGGTNKPKVDKPKADKTDAEAKPDKVNPPSLPKNDNEKTSPPPPGLPGEKPATPPGPPKKIKPDGNDSSN